jgi:hypothetical protein
MTTQVQDVADQIEEFGAWEPLDPDHLDDTIRNLAAITEAVQKAHRQIAERMRETNVHPDVADAIEEAAGAHGAIADELSGKLSGGIMNRGA